MKRLGIAISIAALLGGAYWMTRPPFFDTGSPLLGSGQAIDLLADLDTGDLGDGWRERRFFRITPAQYGVIEENGTRVLHCTTDNSASILARDTQIPVTELPILSWRWKVSEPIQSDVDEAIEAGDDHPLRFYMQFSNENGETRGAEVIWSNKKYAPGDYKIIGEFYHYVANGLDENVREWHDQSLDLGKLYTDIGGTGTPTLQTLGFFCDSDNTGSSSAGAFSNVMLSVDPS